jgi:hypothetical protein
MASTYSSYKIELIGTGDQAGTWGTTTNTNLGTAIEEAIGGYETYALSTATTTLPYTNSNTSQVFRALFIRFTGSPPETATGAGATVVVPDIEKLYFIDNSITTFGLVIKTAAGAGVTVPNGTKTCVYVNGTDVVYPLTHLTSFSSINATLSGNLSTGTATTVSGTYSRSASSTSLGVTTASAHGLSSSQQVYLDFTSGGATAEDGVYTITVTGSTTFTVTTVLNTAVSGNVTVASYANTFTLTAPISVPAVFGSSGTTGQVLSSQGTGMPPKWSTISSNAISQGDSNVTVTDSGTGAITFVTDGTTRVTINNNSGSGGTLKTNAYRDVTISSGSPTGGSDGDIWYRI